LPLAKEAWTRDWNVRVLIKRWTEQDVLQLRQLHAAGASAARASAALKKNLQNVRKKARELGIPFGTNRQRKKLQQEKEMLARTAAGLSPVQDNPKYRRR
jgi:hypothetical protein